MRSTLVEFWTHLARCRHPRRRAAPPPLQAQQSMKTWGADLGAFGIDLQEFRVRKHTRKVCERVGKRGQSTRKMTTYITQRRFAPLLPSRPPGACVAAVTEGHRRGPQHSRRRFGIFEDFQRGQKRSKTVTITLTYAANNCDADAIRKPAKQVQTRSERVEVSLKRDVSIRRTRKGAGKTHQRTGCWRYGDGGKC